MVSQGTEGDFFFYPEGSRWFLSKEGSNTGWRLAVESMDRRRFCATKGLVEGLECLHCSREPQVPLRQLTYHAQGERS